MAFHDPLTGLANRSLFDKYLEGSIKVCKRHEECGALLFIDLDNFKPVNDSLGHSTDDDLLKEVAPRLSTCIRYEDILARLGVDEFCMGCSIGVTLFFDENVSSEVLLKYADIAMYRAKRDGKNRVRFFETDMQESVE